MNHEFKTLVSVVVPTHNRKELLEKCLNSLFNQTYPREKYEVIVVDDGSNDGTEKLVKKFSRKAICRLRYFKQEKLGPAKARNLGIKNAKEEVVAFIDDDCIANEDWLGHLIKCFDNGVAGIEGKVLSMEDKTPFTHQVENLRGGLYLTANIAYKKELLLEVGLFDESFPNPAGEDWDLVFRILKARYKIKFCERAIVTHISIKCHLSDVIRDTMIEWSAIDIVYERYPELFKETTGHSMYRSFFDGIFLHPFVFAKKWRKYLLLHPSDIPKFVIFYILKSFVITYIAARVLFKKLIKRDG